MKTKTDLIWITEDGDNKAMLLEYARHFGETIPDQAAVLAAIGDGGRLLGFSAVLSTEVISDILIFHVVPEEREKGIEQLMLHEMESTLEATGIGMIRFIMPHDEEMMCFFADEGYDITPNGSEHAVLYSALSYSDVYRKTITEEKVRKAKSISECTRVEQKILKDFFIENRLGTMDFFNPVLSSVVIEGAEVTGLLLCETKPRGMIIYYMYAAEEHSEYLIDCIRVLDRILSQYKAEDPGLMLSFAAGNDSDVSLLHHLAGNVVPIEEFVRDSTAIKILKAM